MPSPGRDWILRKFECFVAASARQVLALLSRWTKKLPLDLILGLLCARVKPRVKRQGLAGGTARENRGLVMSGSESQPHRVIWFGVCTRSSLLGRLGVGECRVSSHISLFFVLMSCMSLSLIVGWMKHYIWFCWGTRASWWSRGL